MNLLKEQIEVVKSTKKQALLASITGVLAMLISLKCGVDSFTYVILVYMLAGIYSYYKANKELIRLTKQIKQ